MYHTAGNFQNVQKLMNNLSDTFLIKLNKIKPIDTSIVNALRNCDTVYFFEESIKNGSVGETFASMLIEN